MGLDFIDAIVKYDFSEKLFTKLVSHGLPSKVNKESLIAVFSSYDYQRKTHFCEFPLVKREFVKDNISIYDIPLFIPTIPLGFSQFCTLEEKKKIEHYFIKKAKCVNEQFLSYENTINKLPEPKKEHSYCQLCHLNYDNYKKHIESMIHKENLIKTNNLFSNIVATFQRIRQFWSENETKIIKESSFVEESENEYEFFSEFSQVKENKVHNSSLSKETEIIKSNNKPVKTENSKGITITDSSNENNYNYETCTKEIPDLSIVNNENHINETKKEVQIVITKEKTKENYEHKVPSYSYNDIVTPTTANQTPYQLKCHRKYKELRDGNYSILLQRDDKTHYLRHAKFVPQIKKLKG